MKIAVVGSRNFNDKSKLFDILDTLEQQVKDFDQIDLIVSGGATGADQLAEEYAKEKGIKTDIYLPQYNLYGRGAALKRNLQIIDAADIVVAFWDGKSPGTNHTINESKKREKEVLIINS
jgi:hypothetical protein